MPSLPYDIEKIDRYLSGAMPPPEQEAFEAELRQEAGYREEVAAYRRLYEGLTAARAEAFRQQMAAWETAVATEGELELIDWYLNGELQGAGRAAFEARLAQDAALAAELEAYRQLQEGFQAARGEAFREKIQHWESQQAPKSRLRPASRRPLLFRLAAAAAVLLILGLSLRWYAKVNYADTALAAQFYQAPLSETTLGDSRRPGLDEMAQAFEQAHARFQQDDFPAAFAAFEALLQLLPAAELDPFNRQYYQEQADWGRLLAALAMPAPPLDVSAEAQRIAADERHEFQAQAAELARKLRSPLYRWAN